MDVVGAFVAQATRVAQISSAPSENPHGEGDEVGQTGLVETVKSPGHDSILALAER